MKYFDYDNDGNLDLFLANGHPDDKIEEHSTEVQLLRNQCFCFTTMADDLKTFLLPVVRFSPSPMPHEAWQWVTSITMEP